jgi:hypothetical protein
MFHISSHCPLQVLERTYLEWFAFRRVDDAAMAMTTSFSFTAYSANAKLPMTIDYRTDPREPQCIRRTWDLRADHYHSPWSCADGDCL